MKTILLCVMSFCANMLIAQTGTLDPSFGMNGIVNGDIGSPFNYPITGRQVLIQHDSSMFLVISYGELTTITKKHPDGSPDMSYGNNGTSVPLAIYAKGSAIQTDGKILIAGSISIGYRGYNTSDIAILRLNTNGTLDSRFSANGINILDLAESEGAQAITIQPDGKIVIAGGAFSHSERQRMIIARLNVDGRLDDSFATFGIQDTDFGDFSYAATIAIQIDEKIVVAGTTLVRYDSTGTIDSTFNGEGRQFIQGEASAIGIQNDGRIIVATNSPYMDTLSNFALYRYNTDGSVDSTFGENGMQKTDFDAFSQTATTMTIQTDSKIILGAYIDNASNIDFGIVRYNKNGGLDNSFSGDGLLTTDFSSGNDYLYSIALRDDGRLLAIGGTNNGGNTRVAVAQYDSYGNPYPFFDGNNTFTDRLNQGSTFYTSTATQSDSKILAAGYTWNGSNYDFALTRYDSTGSLDTTFSRDGIQTTDFDFSDDKAKGIVIQEDGKIVVCGSSGEDFALARYTPDGSLDISFAGDGMQVTDFGSSESAAAVAVQNDGKIIAGGTVLARYNSDGLPDATFGSAGYIAGPFSGMALHKDGKIVTIRNSTISRYNLNGSVDSSFGDNGDRLLHEFFILDDFFATSIKIQDDDKIIIGGQSFYSWKGGLESVFSLGRLNTDGNFDPTFHNGTAVYSDNFLDFATSVTIQNDGKIIQAGYSNDISDDNFMVTRHNSDGSPDNTFGINGMQITHVSAANDRITALAVTSNYLYAVGYGQYPGNLGVVARYLPGPEGGPEASASISVIDGDWNDPNTWYGGVVPSESAEVIVQHKVTISSNTKCYSLKVELPSGNLIVNAGVNLIITN